MYDTYLLTQIYRCIIPVFSYYMHYFANIIDIMSPGVRLMIAGRYRTATRHRTLHQTVTASTRTGPFIMPPPRGHNAVIGVCRLMSRTSALTRKPKGVGRRNFAQEYPRSHATPTPTSRSKVKVTGSISAPQRNVPIFRKRIQLHP